MNLSNPLIFSIKTIFTSLRPSRNIHQHSQHADFYPSLNRNVFNRRAPRPLLLMYFHSLIIRLSMILSSAQRYQTTVPKLQA
jgi:hypothetical protein